MTGKIALYALAILVLTGSMAVAVLADDRGMDAYGPADPLIAAEPELEVAYPEVGEIREPMETGAVPERSSGSSVPHFFSGGSSDPTYWQGGP